MTRTAPDTSHESRATDPTVGTRSEPVIVLFDGVCNLCNGVIQFLLRRDPGAVFRFAALQSPAAQERIEEIELPGDPLSSIVVLEDGQLYTRSDAVIVIARHLPGAWRSFTLLRLVPRPLRDWAYRLVARNRYRVWGRREECMVPTPEIMDRFL